MHIHTYQVDNVLNVYRKQLSQKTKSKIADAPSSAPSTEDRVSLSDDGQREVIIKQVSEDIIKRVSGYSHQNDSGKTETDRDLPSEHRRRHPSRQNDFEFTYTMIDENNRKTTNSIHINGLSPISTVGPQIQKMES